jgi:hypothetical protein
LSHPNAHVRKSQQQQAAANPAKPVQDEVKQPVVQDAKRPVMPGQPGHPGELDWTTMFQPGTHEQNMYPVFPQSMPAGQEPIHAHIEAERKFYPTTTAGAQEGGMNGLYLASTMSGDGTVQPARQ